MQYPNALQSQHLAQTTKCQGQTLVIHNKNHSIWGVDHFHTTSVYSPSITSQVNNNQSLPTSSHSNLFTHNLNRTLIPGLWLESPSYPINNPYQPTYTSQLSRATQTTMSQQSRLLALAPELRDQIMEYCLTYDWNEDHFPMYYPPKPQIELALFHVSSQIRAEAFRVLERRTVWIIIIWPTLSPTGRDRLAQHQLQRDAFTHVNLGWRPSILKDHGIPI